MDDYVSADLARPRFTMQLLGIFAGTALVLAAMGLYGVMAFWVTQRTREIGVRMALGAQYGDVLKLVLLRAMWLSAAGIAIGVAVTLGVGRAVSGLLYGITPADPSTLAVAAVGACRGCDGSGVCACAPSRALRSPGGAEIRIARETSVGRSPST